MKQKHRKPDQILQAINFSERLTDTTLWLRMADDLISAANILETEVVKYWSEIQVENQRIVKTSDRKYVQEAYSLLIAYALENYFKALLIHRNQNDLKGRLLTKLPGYFKKHDLVELASKIKLNLDISEEELLCRLSRSSVWAARYPIPIGHEALTSVKKFSSGQYYFIAYYAPQDIERINNFVVRLRNHVLNEIEN